MDRNRVVFYAKENLASGYELQKGEPILRAEIKQNYTDINDILELYNLKKYIDSKTYLSNWTQADIRNFKQKVDSYSKTITQFMSAITQDNFKAIYQDVIYDYVSSFWELINNRDFSKNIAKEDFRDILNEKPYVIEEILIHKNLVKRFNTTIRDFFLTHSETAKILLSIYEIKDDDQDVTYHLPTSLSVEDKEAIIINFLDLPNVNINYLPIIQNARNREDFKLSDRTRLKAYRLYRTELEKLFNTNRIESGILVSFPENVCEIKDGKIKDDFTIEYAYSLDFIKANNNPHALFENFTYLFEYLDLQKRIRLVNKKNNIEVIERFIGLHSINEYIQSIGFNLSEKTSQVQLEGYIQVLENMGVTLESVLHQVYSVVFHEKYGFAENARLYMPTCTSFFEKVRVIAPELESIMKQYKLFVEDGNIDFELLQISSSPTSVKDIPSLNSNKYIYLNNKSLEISNVIQLFFSDQTFLGYVEPYTEKKYATLYDVLSHEVVAFDKYEDFQKPKLKYLIDKNYLFVDDNGNIQCVNPIRVRILYDLFQNEVGSFHWYRKLFQQEVKKMGSENILYFENTLFSKPEQDYFNFYLNKSAFTNGLDLRNKYAHGTQANLEEIEKHRFAYHTYLRLIVLALLKIEDDLMIQKYFMAKS